MKKELVKTCVSESFEHGFCCYTLQYCDKYGENVGLPPLQEWRKVLCIKSIVNSIVNLETYRDSWDDDELLQEALKSPHFTQLGIED